MKYITLFFCLLLCLTVNSCFGDDEGSDCNDYVASIVYAGTPSNDQVCLRFFTTAPTGTDWASATPDYSNCQAATSSPDTMTLNNFSFTTAYILAFYDADSDSTLDTGEGYTIYMTQDKNTTSATLVNVCEDSMGTYNTGNATW
ncbi:MAG: hypothetical protein GY754_01315 [bacterium]|nr:hypothetical protein [bacterium]